ncbi:MAG: c-type cytochrome [Deltaproteobacteria bacterium]|nr:c-type cytochrome [Deltaproteobacteria bacterium]
MRSNLIFVALLTWFLAVSCQSTKVDPEVQLLLEKLQKEGDLISAKSFEGEIPNDPFDPAWQTATGFQIPLGSQVSVAPRASSMKKMEITVRSLVSRKEVGFLISWDDPTRDTLESGVTRFRDAVALGFPIDFGVGKPIPYIGMGSAGHPVNIWHWKSSWEGGSLPHPASRDEGPIPPNPSASDGRSPILRRDPLEAGYPVNHRTGEEAGNPLSAYEHRSPVENLVSEGFGTLTSVSSKQLNGKGIWKDGRWSVVLKRSRSVQETAVDLSLSKGGLIPITFAVWDGSGGERNGMKGLTRWRFLKLEGESVRKDYLQSFMIGPIPGADPEHGKQLTAEMGCNLCHNFPNQPAMNDVGPDLSHAGLIHRAEYLLESVKNPSAVVVPAPGYFDPKTLTSTMPSFEGQVAEQDFRDLAEYLRRLQ